MFNWKINCNIVYIASVNKLDMQAMNSSCIRLIILVINLVTMAIGGNVFSCMHYILELKFVLRKMMHKICINKRTE